jgi:hypothetical protein
MAKLFNLAEMTTATTGTGIITLSAEILGALSFDLAGVLSGDTITYAIVDGAHSELGTGVYSASAKTLTRSVIASTNGNAVIDLSGNAWSPTNTGGVRVSITPSAGDIVSGQLIALIEDQKSSGINGGTFTSGADRTRDLNTLVYNRDSIVSLASNQFTLPAGAWEIGWRCPGFYVQNHQSMLYNYTDSIVVARGSSEYSHNVITGSFTQSASIGHVIVTTAASKSFELRHHCAVTQETNGFGVQGSFVTEVYSQVEIRSA